MDKVLWNSQAEPVTKPLNTIIYELRGEDAGHGLMLDALSMAELMADPDIEAVPVLDAMVVEVGRLQPKMEILQRIMAAAGETVKPTEMAISDPVRYKGAAQVMVLFTMSDGQTVSVWFHNPDTTPAKLMPLDELISWKWMLNKKDVTIVVAPERGRDLNPREVSRRIMRLVERNSAAFLKANAKVAEKAAQLQALDTEIAELQTELTDVQRQIEVAKVEAENRPRKTLRAWQSEEYSARDPADGAAVIDRWDGGKADALLASLGVEDVAHESVAREFIAQFLQGRVVKTHIGDCLINSQSRGKLPRAAGRKGGLKLLAIARIPEILIDGQVGGMEPLSKVREDSFDGFYPFTHVFEVGGRKLKARLQVAHRAAAPSLVYSLDVYDGVLDAIRNKEASKFPVAAPACAVVDMGSKEASGLILDQSKSVVNDDDGLNIEILQVWDSDGNELDPETGDRLVPVAADVSFDDFLAAVVIELATKGNMSAAEAKKLTDDEVTNLVRDGFDDKTPAEQVADQILAANKRSPAVERAYAIAGILMTQYGWSKSDENEYPETGILVDSPRDSTRWVLLEEQRGVLSWDAAKAVIERAEFGNDIDSLATMQDADIAQGFDRADFEAETGTDDDGMIEEGEEFAGKTPAFAYAAEMLRKGAAAAGATVQFGDFSGSTTEALFDKATPSSPYAEVSVYGITAQIGVAGQVLARAMISEEGKISILKGTGGMSALGEPRDEVGVRQIVADLMAAEAAKPVVVIWNSPLISPDGLKALAESRGMKIEVIGSMPYAGGEAVTMARMTFAGQGATAKWQPISQDNSTGNYAAISDDGNFNDIDPVVSKLMDRFVEFASKPTDSVRGEWGGLVLRALEELGGVDTSDAQGLMDARPFLTAELWAKKATPDAAAQAILNEFRAETVDAAYKFANASDAFRSAVVGSIGKESYSPFLSAKNIEEAAKKHGATVAWRLAMVLDSVGDSDDDEDPDGEDDDFDAEAEFDACPDGDGVE